MELENNVIKAFQKDKEFTKLIDLGLKWEIQLKSLSYTKKEFLRYLGNYP